jgi:Sulfatase
MPVSTHNAIGHHSLTKLHSCKDTHPSIKVPSSTSDNPVNVSTAQVGRSHFQDHVQETPHPTTVKPLNILIFYPDDWRYDSIGGVGPVVQTPFLNKLAKEGMRFSHNCVTTSICWVSRASYFTGQYASRHKTLRLHRPKFYRSFKQASWPGLLRKAGFHVGHIGKW